MTLTNLRVANNGSFALNPAKGGMYNNVLAANVPEIITVPSGDGTNQFASHVFFAGNLDFWVSYIYKDGGVTELSDLATNGAFTTDVSWTKGTGWTIGSGTASSDGSQAGNSDLSQSPSVVIANQWYWVTFTVSGYSAGNVRAVIGEGTAGTNRASNATFTEAIKAGSDGVLLLRADVNFVGSVDNFSAVPAAMVPTVDDATGRASELNPTVRDISGVSAISIVAGAATLVSLAFFQG